MFWISQAGHEDQTADPAQTVGGGDRIHTNVPPSMWAMVVATFKTSFSLARIKYPNH